MSFSDALQLLKRKWLLLILVPLVFGISTYFFARHLPKTYSSDTTLYTGIASGYSLTGNAEANFNTTSNAFDNLINLIKARSTGEEVAYRLLADHLWQTSQQPALQAAPEYNSLRENVSEDMRKELLGATPSATLQNVRRYAQANNTNALYWLLNSNDPTYSLKALATLTVSRIGTSDLLRLEYENINPAICRQTLNLVTQVFLQQSRGLREGQTSSVVAYYEAELDSAKNRLTAAERENLAFNQDNNIINYDEQSRNIAIDKDALNATLTTVRQEYEGAQAVLQAINQKLGNKQAALLSSSRVLEQRQKLSKLNAALADQQLFNTQKEANNAKAKELQAEIDKTSQAILSNVNQYNDQANTAEGIPNANLLAEWLQTMILVETNRAKLNVLTQRQNEFEKEYRRMAPLGATLKGIQRKISLAEQNYLAVLASLNASKASQKNTQFAGSLKVIDPPNLPVTPKTNLLVLLLLLSTLGGFVFVVGLVLGLGLMDKSLRNPLIASRRIGLPVAGVMLDTHALATQRFIAYQQRSLDQLVHQILLKANTPPAPVPFVVGVFSVQRQEGKTTLCQALAQRCHEMGVQTLALYPDREDIDETLEAPSLFYPSAMAAVQGWQLDKLIQNAVPKRMTEISQPNVQVVLIEFPALLGDALPVGVLRQLNLIFLTVPATRTWRPTDHQIVERLRSATNAPVEVVLSGVELYQTEESLS
ncbi:GumC family protein [Hymenobacter profundi]|uniref:Polysaccharide chain length determinant N-terminal domain-containing protein n=1 Tax=Hymenobacter profundi TaxID=1982110 RepID=A0ABS6WVP5_9BACT|nr:hypothetical protein [Hymenobacter profundi]MBW3127681.1 hypothetical protein [Hymenobacter profundi]